MKRYKIFAIAALAAMTVSCGEDFLTTHSTQQGEAGGAATEGAILSYLASSYQPLVFDSYANFNYNEVLLLSDLRSDDLYKGGGDASDQSWMYHLSLFQIPASESPSGLWSIYFTGIARANNTLIACENAVGFDSDVAKQRLAGYQAEGYFLRAYYYHLLWKFYGNIPYFTEPLPEPFMAVQQSADQIYGHIMDDIAAAENAAAQAGSFFPLNNNGDKENEARANLAALYMLKARVVMYQKDQSKYNEVAGNMAKIINEGGYSLMASFDDIWLDENEFCSESIFESNQEIRLAMTQMIDGTLTPENPSVLQDLYHSLLLGDWGSMGDSYFVLKDFGSYSMAQRRLNKDYSNRKKWLKMAVTNTAMSGIFSSDRTISEYNDLIWHLEPYHKHKKAGKEEEKKPASKKNAGK